MSHRSTRPLSRRRFLRYSGASVLGWLLTACGPRPSPPATTQPTATALPSPTPTARVLSPSELLHNENRPGFYIRYIKPFPPPDVENWRLSVGGLVAKPVTLSLAEIETRLPLASQVSRMKCVDCWSAKAGWGGFTYATLAALVRPLDEATHVYFDCIDGYWEILPIEELARDRALFVHRMNGERLPPAHGAPLRLILPWLYGYKNAKAIATIDFRAQEGRGYWSTVASYSPQGDVQPGFDRPLDLEDGARQIPGGEITEY